MNKSFKKNIIGQKRGSEYTIRWLAPVHIRCVLTLT